MGKYVRILLLFGVVASISACNFVRELSQEIELPDQISLDGRLLVWHTWEEPAAGMLEEMLASFVEVNPGVHIVSEYVATNQLGARFEDRISAGLGPDVLIGTELTVINDLIGLDALLDLNELGVDIEFLLPVAVEALQTEEGQLFGVPIAAHTNVLYHNKDLASAPVTTLDQLIEAASAGQVVAIPTDFYQTFWGARAFQKQIVNNQGEINIDNDFAGWLTWLLRAQEEPSIILSDDYSEMHDMFTEGQAAYFIGDSKDAPYLRAALGDEAVGISLLPLNQVTDENAELDQNLLKQAVIPEGSFLEIESASISKLSTETELAKRLIEFLINPIHQRELTATDLGHIPVSAKVRFDSRIPPAAATMIRQSSNTGVIPVELQPFVAELAVFGDEIYTQVLEGVLTPEEATWRLAERVWSMDGGHESQ